MTLCWYDKKFGMRNVIDSKESMRWIYRAIIFALNDQGRCGDTTEVSAAVVHVKEKTRQ
jgi:hypothetical protein